MKYFEALLPNHILSDINLYALSIVLKVRETRLPHQPVGNDSPGHPDSYFLRFQIRRRGRTVLFHKVCSSRRPAKFMRVGVQPRGAKLLELLHPLFVLVPRLKFQVGFLISHKLSGSPSEYSGHSVPVATNLWFYFGTLLYCASLKGNQIDRPPFFSKSFLCARRLARLAAGTNIPPKRSFHQRIERPVLPFQRVAR